MLKWREKKNKKRARAQARQIRSCYFLSKTLKLTLRGKATVIGCPTSAKSLLCRLPFPSKGFAVRLTDSLRTYETRSWPLNRCLSTHRKQKIQTKKNLTGLHCIACIFLNSQVLVALKYCLYFAQVEILSFTRVSTHCRGWCQAGWVPRQSSQVWTPHCMRINSQSN